MSGSLEPQASRILAAIPPVRGSPAWHRRLRAKRSLVRKKIKQQLPVTVQERLRLALHHGTCPEESGRLLSMGKRGGGKGQQQRWEDYPSKHYSQQYGARSWDIWPGAWKSPKGGKYQTERDYDRQHSFPAYDANWKEAKGIVAIQTRRTDNAPAQPSLVQAVQSAVNQARKMDGRLAALREELVARKDKWEAYKLEMQQAYQVERNRFVADVGRLEQEIAEMVKSQEESHRNITVAAASGTGQREHMAMAVAEEWQALCASQDVPASALSQELMRMVALLTGGGQGSASAMPTTPPHRPAGGLPLTPPSVSGNGGGIPNPGPVTDPYMVGPERPPETTADGATPAALGSASRAAHGQRPRPAEGGYRKAVKPVVPPAPKAAPSPSLGDKLWEKRLKEQEDARTAMLPFRRRGGGVEPGAHEGSENAGPDPPPMEDMRRAGTQEISEDSEMDTLE